jgi:AcrR family transcriptional regulator
VDTTRSTRIRDKAVKQQALLAAALELFAKNGYEATTTRKIAACAGCAEGLIHRYFGGKAGLLTALMKDRISQEQTDLSEHLKPASTFAEEYQQLVVWAVGHMWDDREFLRMAIPHALLHSEFGNVLSRIGPNQRAKAIKGRFRKFKECRSIPPEELEGLVQSVSVLGFTFGFMRPVVLLQDRETAAQQAITMARLLLRGVSSCS